MLTLPSFFSHVFLHSIITSLVSFLGVFSVHSACSRILSSTPHASLPSPLLLGPPLDRHFVPSTHYIYIVSAIVSLPHHEKHVLVLAFLVVW
jgi:hypothetical protein